MNYCPKCGFEVREMKFCPKCGFELQNKSTDSPVIINNTDTIIVGEDISDSEQGTQFVFEDYRAELIGEKANHYLPIFDGMTEKDHASWNWCAFLFGPMWFAYRKLYGWAVIVFVVQNVVSALFGLLSFSASGLLARIAGLVIAAIFAQRANYELKKRVDRLILEMPSDDNERRLFIKKKGGTSAIALLIAIVIVLSFAAASIMLAGLAGASQY